MKPGRKPKPDRAALTLRLEEPLRRQVEELASSMSLTANDVLVQMVREGLLRQRAGSEVDAYLRRLTKLASEVILRVTDTKTPGPDELPYICAAIVERLLPLTTNLAVEGNEDFGLAETFWEQARTDVIKHGLRGGVWDDVRVIDPRSPPMSEKWIEQLRIAWKQAYESQPDRKSALEVLDVFLGNAVHYHAEAWRRHDQMKAQATDLIRKKWEELLLARAIGDKRNLSKRKRASN